MKTLFDYPLNVYTCQKKPQTKTEKKGASTIYENA